MTEQKEKLIELTFLTEQAVLKNWENYLFSINESPSDDSIKHIIYCLQHLTSDPNIKDDLLKEFFGEDNEDKIKKLDKCFDKIPKLTDRFLFLKRVEKEEELKEEEKLQLKENELLEIFYFLINKTTLRVKKEKEQKKRPPIPLALRLAVFKRDNYKCTICGRATKDGITLEADHKTPIDLGGTDDFDNLTTKCSECNLGKSNRIVD